MLFGKDKAVKVLRDKLGMTNAEAETAFDVFNTMIQDAADAGDGYRIPGVGIITRNDIPAHEATNPGNGAKVNVPARFNYKLKSPTQDLV